MQSRREFLINCLTGGMLTIGAAGAAHLVLRRRNNDHEYVEISNEAIQKQLRKFPDVWEEFFGKRTDVGYPLLGWERIKTYDPRNLETAFGAYRVNFRNVVVPSIWSAVDVKKRDDLRRLIQQAIPHEVGHFISEDLDRITGYKLEGPSLYTLVNDLVGPIARELGATKKQRLRQILETKLAFPYYVIHRTLVESMKDDYECLMTGIDGKLDTTASMAAQRIKATIGLCEVTLNNVIETPLNKEGMNKLNLGMYPSLSEDFTVLSAAYHLATGEHYFRNPRFNDFLKAAPVWIRHIKSAPKVTANQVRQLEEGIDESLMRREVFADYICAIINAVHQPQGIIKHIPDEAILNGLAEIKYDGKYILRPCIDEYTRGRNISEKNGVVVGDIGYFSDSCIQKPI